MQQLLTSLLNHQQPRQTLSLLRKEIKDPEKKTHFYPFFIQNTSLFFSFLSEEDAKTRKNAALLIGDMGALVTKKAISGQTKEKGVPPVDATVSVEIANTLFSHYKSETTRFVRSSYLEALTDYDYTSLLGQLSKQLEQLSNQTVTEQERKHQAEELSMLSKLITAKEGISQHEFTGYHIDSECILVTNKLHKSVTEEQLLLFPEVICKPFAGGIRLKTNRLECILPIRTYQELLFGIPGISSLDADPYAAAAKLGHSALPEFLETRHQGSFPFYFRVELRAPMPAEKKSQFIHRFAGELERLTDRKLVNSPSDYEIELRLIMDKANTLHPLFKLHTIKDTRFSYRREYQANSIRPHLAALLAALAKPYMKENARVLDPFCGVGTMLIEREKLLKADTSYGIDISGEALAKAARNTKAAGQLIHYINRDFQSFTHEHPFDEIFTDMPFVMGNTGQEALYKTYEAFFVHSKTVLHKDGILILYTRNADYAKRLASQNSYRLIRQFPISEKEASVLMILK